MEDLSVVGCLEGEIPCMPTVPAERSHRPKLTHTYARNALTVRPFNKKQAQADPAAAASINKEWKRLRDRKAWDETTVREWSDVAADTRRNNEEVHMGMLLGLVVEKIPTFLPAAPAASLKAVWYFRATTL